VNLESITTGTGKIQAERAMTGRDAVLFYHEKSVPGNFFDAAQALARHSFALEPSRGFAM
jgi:hypothetical protein